MMKIFYSNPQNIRLFSLFLLLIVGASANSDSTYNHPPLNWAAEYGQFNIAALLIEKGADVNVSDHLDNTPLHLGIKYPAIVELLLQNNARVNSKNAFGNTPLHLSIRYKSVVELLIKNGANVNAKNVFNKTPFDYCMRVGTSLYNLSIMEILINAGAGIKVK